MSKGKNKMNLKTTEFCKVKALLVYDDESMYLEDKAEFDKEGKDGIAVQSGDGWQLSMASGACLFSCHKSAPELKEVTDSWPLNTGAIIVLNTGGHHITTLAGVVVAGLK
jgi:hypothetical protein